MLTYNVDVKNRHLRLVDIANATTTSRSSFAVGDNKGDIAKFSLDQEWKDAQSNGQEIKALFIWNEKYYISKIRVENGEYICDVPPIDNADNFRLGVYIGETIEDKAYLSTNSIIIPCAKSVREYAETPQDGYGRNYTDEAEKYAKEAKFFAEEAEKAVASSVSAGLYDDNGLLVAPWNVLVENGLNIEHDWSESEGGVAPNSLKQIAVRLGLDTENISRLVIPYGVVRIGSYATKGWGFRSIITTELPSSVRYIGEHAFDNTNDADGTSATVAFDYNSSFVSLGQEFISSEYSRFVIRVPSCTYLESSLNAWVLQFGYIYQMNGTKYTADVMIFEHPQPPYRIAHQDAFENVKKILVPQMSYDKYVSALGVQNKDKIDTYVTISELSRIIDQEKKSIQEALEQELEQEKYGYSGEELIVYPQNFVATGTTYAGNTTIKCVVLPESVKEINEGAFQGCTALEVVKVYGRLDIIGKNAFKGCAKLKTIEYMAKDIYGRPMTAKRIRGTAFVNSGLKQIDVTTTEQFDSAAFGTVPVDGAVHCASLLDWLEGYQLNFFENASSSPLFNMRNLVINGERVKNLDLTPIAKGYQISRTIIPKFAFVGGHFQYIKIPRTVGAIYERAFDRNNEVYAVDLTDYGSSYPFPTVSADVFTSDNATSGKAPTTIFVPKGRKSELMAMTNWSKWATDTVVKEV